MYNPTMEGEFNSKTTLVLTRDPKPLARGDRSSQTGPIIDPIKESREVN